MLLFGSEQGGPHFVCVLVGPPANASKGVGKDGEKKERTVISWSLSFSPSLFLPPCCSLRTYSLKSLFLFSFREKGPIKATEQQGKQGLIVIMLPVVWRLGFAFNKMKNGKVPLVGLITFLLAKAIR